MTAGGSTEDGLQDLKMRYSISKCNISYFYAVTISILFCDRCNFS
jgi:C4-type Zn-finger protein